MFKRHVYTCPDVIHIMNRQRRINHASIGVSLILVGGLYMWGLAENHKIKLEAEKLQES